ncbi:acyl carrier protein [Streptomyces puniciscabiei]
MHCDPWETDGGAAFAELGIDSVLAADLTAGVNRAHGLSECPVTLHEHPTLAAMASCIASRTRGTVTSTGAAGRQRRTGRSRREARAVGRRRRAAALTVPGRDGRAPRRGAQRPDRRRRGRRAPGGPLRLNEGPLEHRPFPPASAPAVPKPRGRADGSGTANRDGRPHR